MKAKGLLSLMLSLPENWDCTLAGLARISLEGKDGKFGCNEYVIREYPVSHEPSLEDPSSENLTTDYPATGLPSPVLTTQINKDSRNRDKRNTDSTSKDMPYYAGKFKFNDSFATISKSASTHSTPNCL